MAYNYAELKVLIVDDSPLMLDLMRGLLRIIGFKLICAVDNTNDGWSVFNKFTPDLVITDWNMPPPDGMEFVKKIRNHPDTTNQYVPIIVLTGYAEHDRVQHARDAGMTAFILKPITAEELFRRIKMVVDDDRNFVKAGHYFGPDRRRTNPGAYSAPERRTLQRAAYSGPEARQPISTSATL